MAEGDGGRMEWRGVTGWEVLDFGTLGKRKWSRSELIGHFKLGYLTAVEIDTQTRRHGPWPWPIDTPIK
jgi:hypothetical protein